MGIFKMDRRAIRNLKLENLLLQKDNERLRLLCAEKDSYFLEMISDGLRHGSSLAAKHMVERNQYLKGK